MKLNESDTRSKLIDPSLHARSRAENLIRCEETVGATEIVGGKARKRAKGRVDYLLRVAVNAETQPVAVAPIEARSEMLPPDHGLEQGKLYASCKRLNAPFVFSTNGHPFIQYDSTTGLTNRPRPLTEFPTPDELREGGSRSPVTAGAVFADAGDIPMKRPLPEGWRWVKLGEVCEVVNGFGFREDLQGRADLPFPFVKVSDMNASGSKITIQRAANTVDQSILQILGAKTYPAGTVIFPKVGGALLTNKKRILGIEATFDNNIMGLVPKEVESAWVFYWVQTVDLAALARTQALPSIRQSEVADLLFPLPPLAEQKRIAAILREQMTAVERARRAAEEQREAAKALPAAFLRRDFPRPGQPLPDGWRWVKLGEVCEERTGVRDPRQQPDSQFRYVDITSVDNKAKRIIEPKTLFGRDAPSRARQVIRTGDVLVATTRPNLNAVALVPPELDNEICSTGFCVLRARTGLNPAFLFAWVQTPDFVQGLVDLVKGALYPAVTDNQVRAQEIPLPPLAEQQRIAALLREQMAAVERARRAAEEQPEAAKALPAAFLRRDFPRPGQPLPDGWRWVKLGEVCKQINYGYTASADFGVNDPRFLRITDIQNGAVCWDQVPGCKISEDKEAVYSLADGDIVFARTGATTGKSFLIHKPPRSVFASYLIRVRVKDELMCPEYTYAFFQSEVYWQQIRSKARGAGQPNVNASLLSRLEIPLPPLAEQQRIAAVLCEQMAAAERARQALEAQLEAINQLSAAILRKAFNGAL